MLNFTLKQLKYVEATGRLGSIAKAATDLNISQSSITVAINSLESEIGYDLFTRTPAKGIKLTPAGRDGLRIIRAFMDQSRHFAAEIQQEPLGGDVSGSVRIACYATAAPSFLPPILKSLTLSHKNISIKFLEGDMEDIIEFLDQGEADLAFCYREMMSDRHHFMPLFEAPPYALLSINNPMSNSATTSLFELSKEPMIMLDLPRAKDYFMSLFEQHGLKPNIVHSSRSVEIIRTLVASGYGYSLLNIIPPDYLKDVSTFQILPLEHPAPAPVFGIAVIARTKQPSIVKSFLQKCLELKQRGAFKPMVVS
jgi:DNA-binding transcriptional LysR family regulator